MKTEHKAPEMSGIFKELAENFISIRGESNVPFLQIQQRL